MHYLDFPKLGEVVEERKYYDSSNISSDMDLLGKLKIESDFTKLSVYAKVL